MIAYRVADFRDDKRAGKFSCSLKLLLALLKWIDDRFDFKTHFTRRNLYFYLIPFFL